MSIKSFAVTSWSYFNKTLDFLTPFGDLFIRFWIAKVFFLAGLTKIQTWDTTVFLFTHEYQVPLLSPKIAAMLGAAVELTMPALILLGLFGRLPALILFIFNIVAVISYPYLLTAEGAVGLNDHFYWGLLLLVILLHGTGKISIDYLVQWFYKRSKSKS